MIRALLFSKLNLATVGLGLLCFWASGCSSSRKMTAPQMVRHIVRFACGQPELRRTPLRVVSWRGDDTLRYNVNAGGVELTDDTPFLLGALTTAFVADRTLNLLDSLNVSPGEVALRVPRPNGTSASITYESLLLHTSGLPVYKLNDELDAAAHLAAFAKTLQTEPWGEVGRYKFDYWNYVLLEQALRQNGLSGGPLTDRRLSYTPSLDSASKRLLVETPPPASSAAGKRQYPELFARSSGGVASMRTLEALLERRIRAGWTDLPSATVDEKSELSVVPGWLRLEVRQGRTVYLALGRTRMHGVVVAYHPLTNSGAIITAAAPYALDCLALDILRNLNDDWKATEP